MVRQWAVVALLLAGCIGPMPAEQPPPPCDGTTDFTFVGRTSMAALGLGDPMDPEAGRVGMAWVTRGPVSWGPPGRAQPGEMSRAACMSWEDGSGMGQSIEGNWQPPNAIFGGDGTVDPTNGPSGGLLVLVVLAAVLVGASVIAFRRDSPQRAGD